MNLASEALQFLRSTQRGILSTHSTKFDGYPFGSVAPFVLDHSCQPVILISTIAEHTKNIIANPKVSLLVFAGDEDLQANARLTLLGNAVKIDKDDANLRARYLRYLPQAAGYFDMHDFSFYRIEIAQMRYIAGFGKMGWLSGEDITFSASEHGDQLAEIESAMITHMNQDHADSLIAYCKHFHDLVVSHATILGIDSAGFDVRAETESHIEGNPETSSKILRFNFEQAIHDAQSARQAFVSMSKAAQQ
ncbi:pyridoxamine 5'-phosphate oxidase [mine drainage metagenome]|uniref:Pyridoxamine 5'-phosphate oxidase n=1 Tax=mine drainage metagenome TaxID=410659 RepID=A0A1J5S7K5_9ZZZZ